MGMYDIINGEQVKCFSWISLYNGEISYHGGYLARYGEGSEVPFRRAHYNYGKNFIILDINRFPDPEDDYYDYDYILHVIVDGKVKNTFRDRVGDIDWTVNKLVIGYKGEMLNINSSEDLLSYIKAQRDYWQQYEDIHSHWNELFRESMKYFSGIGLLANDSEEKRARLLKIDEIHKLMEAEKARIKPDIEALEDKYSKWFTDTSDINDLITLGEYLSAYELSYNDEGDKKRECEKEIKKMLNADSTLYGRYIEWQGTDEYIKAFGIQRDKEM